MPLTKKTEEATLLQQTLLVSCSTVIKAYGWGANEDLLNGE